MQNWYSQNSPFKSKGVAVGKTVCIGRGVFVAGIIASVVATASSTGRVGVVDLLGNEQDAKMNRVTVIKNCLIR